MGNLKNLAALDISYNQLTSNIPSSLGECTSLRWLYMDHNMFEGTIESLHSLKAIEEIDLSHNNVSGHIPKDFGKFVFLSMLNLSFNHFESEVQSGGIFSNVSANVSLAGNSKLCGGIAQLHLTPCFRKLPRKQHLSFPVKMILSIVCGRFERRGASKSFMAESLRNIRHRNLVKIITACSSVDFQGNDFKALIYELMPNGSLEDWLHLPPQTGENQRKSLTLALRQNMVIDVASALDYLHNHSEPPIIRCDLKPSNIQLDQDMTTHVSDFGLSRIIAEDNVEISQNHTSSLGIRGTI